MTPDRNIMPDLLTGVRELCDCDAEPVYELAWHHHQEWSEGAWHHSNLATTVEVPCPFGCGGSGLRAVQWRA